LCNPNKNCKAHDCNSRFQTQEDLIKYRDWLKQELEIVEKTLQDILENAE
jgi:hypothetical protein